MKAGLVLGAVFLMIPGRWAAAAEALPAQPPPAGVEGSTPTVERLPGPADQIYRPEEPPPELSYVYALRGPLFYEAVGRPDLAERYRWRSGAKMATRVLGGVTVAVGALWWMFAKLGDTLLTDCTSFYAPDVCHKTYWGPDITMVAGLAAIVMPSFIDDDPVGLEERARLVETATSRWRPTSLSLAPRVDRDGASLALAGRF
jgi:hypothetical protein